MKLTRPLPGFLSAASAKTHHRIIWYLLLSLFYLSCKKEEVKQVQQAPTTGQDSIKLKIEKTINDSVVVLNWTRFNGRNFQNYRLTRSGWYFKNGIYGKYNEVIDVSNDQDHVRYTENKMPLTEYITYNLVVNHADTSLSNHGFMPSAELLYHRQNTFAAGYPKDVLYDKEQDVIFVIEDKRVCKVSCSDSRILATAQFIAGLGFCSMGNFNGSPELYVPSNDGWLSILDAKTLQVKDKIFIDGIYVASVVAAKGILYVGSSDMQPGFANCIKIYDRATKTLLGRTGLWDATRLYPLDGPDVELIDLTTVRAPRDLSYYHFSPGGALLEMRNDNYQGEILWDAEIVRSFPGGNKFITGASGAIFDKSLVFEQYIDGLGSHVDYAFSDDGKIIYAAKWMVPAINALAYPSLNEVAYYQTKFLPSRIFRNGNTLIVVGKTNEEYVYLIVEKIDL